MLTDRLFHLGLDIPIFPHFTIGFNCKPQLIVQVVHKTWIVNVVRKTVSFVVVTFKVEFIIAMRTLKSFVAAV